MPHPSGPDPRRARPIVWSLLLIVVSVAVMTACSDGTSSTGAPSDTPSTEPDLTRFLLGPGDEPGFEPSGEPMTFSSVAEAFDGLPEEAARASELGFEALAFQPLEGEAGAGVSNVYLFATEEGANGWLSDRVEGGINGEETSTFDVPGVPGARGWMSTHDGDDIGNVVWTQGRCQLTLGNQALRGGELSVEDMQAGVKAIYDRTSGSCP